MYKYRIYGLNVLSNLQLDCYPHEFENTELNLRFSSDISETNKYLEQLCHQEKPVIIEAISGQGKVFICGTDHIITYYQSEYYLKHSMMSYILGFALSYVLFMQRIFCFHGSCIGIHNKATVLIGPSGEGKSTLAAGFSLFGGKVLSDDLTRIEVDTDIPYVYPGYPSRCLTKNSLEKLGIDFRTTEEIIGEPDKYILKDRDAFTDNDLPVDSIIQIYQSDADEIRLVREDIKQSILIITNNIYNSGLLKDTPLWYDYFNFVLAVCERIPIYTLYRPRGMFSVNEQVETILTERLEKADSNDNRKHVY